MTVNYNMYGLLGSRGGRGDLDNLASHQAELIKEVLVQVYEQTSSWAEGCYMDSITNPALHHHIQVPAELKGLKLKGLAKLVVATPRCGGGMARN